MVFGSPCTMRGGISVRPEVVGPHIGGNVWFPPSHRESLLRLAPVPFLRRNRTRDAGVDLPQVRRRGKGCVCHKEWWRVEGDRWEGRRSRLWMGSAAVK
jgi:hypothetical protein